MSETDWEIVQQVRAGDRNAYRLLVDRYSRRIFQLAYRLTGNQDDADEVVQEAFLRAYKRLDRYDGRASFGTWLFRIASNFAVDLRRARGRYADRPDDAPEPRSEALQERLALGGEMRSRYESALARLTDTERAAFVLRHVEGLSIPEASSTLGMSDNATKQSIFRAVKKLRVALAPFAGACTNGV